MSKHIFTLILKRWILAPDSDGRKRWHELLTACTVPASKTMIIVCDMWNAHWSRGANERVGKMVPVMNQVLTLSRERGVHIIHAPSETVNFYADHPARHRMQTLPPVDLPRPQNHVDPPLPIDHSDGGSDTGETLTRLTHRPWAHQHPNLHIDAERDGISDQGEEIYRYYCQHNIEQVLIMGVHTNMCVLNRSFGIRQMVKWGVPIALVRDLTDAMYNPARPPYVSHQKGTDLVIEYIEKFWCPSTTSDMLTS